MFEEVARVVRLGGVVAFSSRDLLNRLVVEPRRPWPTRDRLGFWWHTLRAGRVGDARKLEVDSRGATVAYHDTPFGQRRELREHGFEPLALVPRGGRLSKYFGPWPYSVARRR